MNRSELIEAALGQRPCDLVIQNINLVNVYTGEIYPAAIGVYGEYIAHVTVPGEAPPEGKTVYAGNGKYAVPGFIDTHVHIESSMLTSANFARVVLPHGTTTVLTDPHEIGNVLGLRGVKYMVDSSAGLPLRILILAPSCVPSVPGIETAGADFGAAEIKTMLGWDRVLGIAEVMDYPGVIYQSPRMNEILAAVRAAGGVIQGHSPFLTGRRLSAYLCAGPDSDHEVMTEADTLAKLRAGMIVDAKESSITKNIREIFRAYQSLTCPPNITLCTDDREAADLLHEGHLDEVLRRTIEEGVPPAIAIRIATLQAANRIGLKEYGAIAPGKIADIVLLADLAKVKVSDVFVGGSLVAREGALAVDIPARSFPLEAENTVILDKPLTMEDFTIRAPENEKQVAVRVLAYQAAASLRMDFESVTLPVKDGAVCCDGIPDLNYVAVFERHGRNGNRSLGLLRGFGLTEGAIASTVSHDCHNLTVVGTSASDMLLAARTLAQCGGGLVCVRDGHVQALIKLPIAGLLSPLPAEKLAPSVQSMKEVMRSMGLAGANPLLRVATLTLAVVPKAKITDVGLVEVETQKLLPLFIE
ncbi:MAG: adenine deaminase [bacterium]|jgi:adenine deaminase